MNDVNNAPLFMILAEGVRSIMLAKPEMPRNAVEDYLHAELEHLSMAERLKVLDNLMSLFPPDEPQMKVAQASGDEGTKPLLGETPPASVPEQKDQHPAQEALLDPGFAQLVSLMLGKKMAVADLSPAELSEKVAQALNTVFDTLNQIVEMIQVNLLGRKAEQETIRQIIGSQIGSGSADNSLQNYLDQIREAFLVAHKAFKIAALSVVKDLLAELDPEKIEASSEGRLRFGPLRKAELYEVYKEKFGVCKGWLESGRIMEGFLREFENASQKVYKKGV